MQTITIIENIQEPETWEKYEAEDIRPFLMQRFVEWPETARIFCGEVSEINDVTPRCEADVERLGELKGPFYVIVSPEGPVGIIIAVIVVAVVAAAVMMMMAPPLPTLRNTASESPNNELQARTNKARPNARIPDNYGTGWKTLDLLAVPYLRIENHQDVESAYMTPGRGAYEIAQVGSSYQVKDDKTLYADIAGTSCEIYAPFTSPNSGDLPEITIGDSINEMVRTVKRFTSVNGQTLRPPNEYTLKGDADIYFKTPNSINLVTSSENDFTDYFAAEDNLRIQGAYNYSSWQTETKSVTFYADETISFVIPTIDPLPYAANLPLIIEGASFPIGEFYGCNLSGEYYIESLAVTEDVGVYTLTITLLNPSSVNSDWIEFSEAGVTSVGPFSVSLSVPNAPADYNLDGTFEVLSVSNHEIILSDPAAVNSDWSLLAGLPGGVTENLSPLLEASGDRWVGPITLDFDGMTKVLSNFIGPNGLYKDDGKNQYAVNVRVELELTPVDSAGNPIGAAELFRARLMGSATTKTQRGVSLDANHTFTGPCKARARRISKRNTEFEGQVVDEIKWRDIYAMAPIGKNHFGDMTTFLTKTYATSGMTNVKERKTQALLTRKLPARIADDEFTTELTATNNAADILAAITLDPYIGRRQKKDIDFDLLYSLVGIGGEVSTYFGTDKACEFNYTFDKDNLSFEETFTTIAKAVFCEAYRRDNVLKLSFEQQTDDSTLLFNHRNIHPKSMTREITFGNYREFDGVEFQYVDSDDDALVTLYLPTNRSALNPQKIESVGIRNKLQAWFHAWRAYNRLFFHRISLEFNALSEAAMLIRKDRILVADITRSETQDGYVKEQNALILTLSQPVTFKNGVDYNIFLQLYDKTVESIPIIAGSSNKEVVLSRSPRLPLALDPEYYARTTYIIVGSDEVREQAFLTAETDTQSNFEINVSAINYDARYYQKDKDYVNGVIDIDGNVI